MPLLQNFLLHVADFKELNTIYGKLWGPHKVNTGRVLTPAVNPTQLLHFLFGVSTSKNVLSESIHSMSFAKIQLVIMTRIHKTPKHWNVLCFSDSYYRLSQNKLLTFSYYGNGEHSSWFSCMLSVPVCYYYSTTLHFQSWQLTKHLWYYNKILSK
jgi:hypothetical protein